MQALPRGGHACFAYEGDAFASAAHGVLTEAAARGDAVLLVTADDALARYEGDAFDPGAQVARYRALAEDAVARGYGGLTVAADATPLVRTVEDRRAFARYEHLVDRYRHESGIFTAMCAYDALALGPDALAELAAVHPEGTDGSTPFRLFADGAGGLVLTGELDRYGTDLLEHAFASAHPGHGDALVVDGRELEFIDHRGLLALDRLAGLLARPVILRAGRSIVARLSEWVGAKHLTIELGARRGA
jgi:anti-anti-sigma regulatory factor